MQSLVYFFTRSTNISVAIASSFDARYLGEQAMFRQLPLIAALLIAPLPILVLSPTALSQTTLTQATVAAIRNRVRLIPQNQNPRNARTSDTLRPGDSLATATGSTVDLRFNDNSLARLGEQTVFRFAPRLRSVDLANGTLLLLVQPGNGGTSVRTPNAAVGISGSALFVRYIQESDTTLIGALTTSGITAFNGDATESVELQGGQIAAVVGDRIERVYNFDLQTFYNTSPLTAGLDLTQLEIATDDPMLSAVRNEIATALSAQAPLNQATIANPTLVSLPSRSRPDFPDSKIDTVEFEFTLNSNREDAIASMGTNSFDIRSGLTTGEVQLNSSVVVPSGSMGLGNTNQGLTQFPGRGNTNGIFPGQGQTNGVFPRN
ncbi:MAG: FecR domain-containing protein [Spirulinaceae cyanobacterium]